MRKTLGLLLLGVAGFALGPGAADATLVEAVSLEETIEVSTAIIVGRVLAVQPFSLADGRILTGVTVRVEEVLKGNLSAGERVRVTAYGGELGLRRTVALGEATYRPGERVLLQLETIEGRLHTVALSMGKWTVLEDQRGERHLTRDLSGLGLVGDAEVTAGPIRFEDFRHLVDKGERGRNPGALLRSLPGGR